MFGRKARLTVRSKPTLPIETLAPPWATGPQERKAGGSSARASAGPRPQPRAARRPGRGPAPSAAARACCFWAEVTAASGVQARPRALLQLIFVFSENRKNSKKKNLCILHSKSSCRTKKVLDFLFGHRKVSVKSKKFVNFYSCFSAA